MFYQIIYQTGEIEDVIKEMKNGNIPCMDVDNMAEFEWVVNKLKEHGIYRISSIPLDRKARDVIKEPEFEFRAAFCDNEDGKGEPMYIDFYFEPIVEEDYDPIFGD